MSKLNAAEVMERLRSGLVADLRVVSELLAQTEDYAISPEEYEDRCDIEYLCHSEEEDGSDLDMLGHLLQSDCADQHHVDALQTGIRYGYCIAVEA